MQASSSFSRKMVIAANRQLGRELAEFAGLCACAGIQNAPKQARKARGNHYGEFMTEDGSTYYVPPRKYIWAATRNIGGAGYGEEIKRIIVKGINDNPTPHTQKTITEWDKDAGGYKQVAVGAKHGTPVFAGRNGYRGLLAKIAKQMEINQFNAIEEVNIIGKKHNAEITKKIKGFDHPLVNTGEMQMAITSWVAKQ
jgi:hypothetical protein